MADPVDALLGRIRDALGKAGEWRQPPAPRLPRAFEIDPAERAERFSRELTAVGGRVERVTRAEVGPRLRAIVERTRARTFAAWETELCATLATPVLVGAGLTPLRVTDARSAATTLGPLELGVTEADAAIAETGSLVLASGPGRPRLVSCLPRHHVVLVPETRVTASLTEVPALVRGGGRPPANVAIITGPSRTGDIELILTLGVHGPVTLEVLLIAG